MVLGAALLMALHLGINMARGKAGRGRVTGLQNLMAIRTFLITWVGVVLAWQLFLPRTIPGQLMIQVPEQIQIFAMMLFVLGMTIRIWAQIALGPQWSADLSLLPGHQLVRGGPYAVLNHPMYFSYIIIALSLLFVTGNLLLGGLAFAYALASYVRRRAEDKLLQQRFGRQFHEHRIQTSLSRQALLVSMLILSNLIGMGHELLMAFI